MKEVFSQFRFLIIDHSVKIWLPYIIKNALILILLAFLFYDNMWYTLIISPIFFYLTVLDSKTCKKKDAVTELERFRDFLALMSENLKVGRSAENAVIEAERQLTANGIRSKFDYDLKTIVSEINNNIPLEKALMNAGEQSVIPDFRFLAFIISDMRRCGIELSYAISYISGSIIEKVRVNRESETIISSKRIEQSIMSVIPIGVLAYIRLCSASIIEPLYHNIIGVMIMSIMLSIYTGAVVYSNKLIDIKV